MATNGRVEPNVRSKVPLHKGSQSYIPHPPPEDRPTRRMAPGIHEIPDTGWWGELPSKKGGTYEKDYMHKPPYKWKSEGNLFRPKYHSQCWCGHVAFEFHGDPLDARYCHCRQCQRLHGAPFQWAVIFPKTSVRMIRNEGNALHFFSTQDQTAEHSVPCKVSCNVCRSPIFDEGRNTVLAYPSSFRFKNNHIPLDFQPTAHIFYSQRVMDLPDGVPKWSGHKGESELLQEMEKEGTLPNYMGKPNTCTKGEKEDQGRRT